MLLEIKWFIEKNQKNFSKEQFAELQDKLPKIQKLYWELWADKKLFDKEEINQDSN